MAEDRSSERVPCEKVVCVKRFYIHIYNYIYICIYIYNVFDKSTSMCEFFGDGGRQIV